MNPLAILGRLGDSVAVPAAPAQAPHGAWQRNWRELVRKALEKKRPEKPEKRKLPRKVLASGRGIFAGFEGTAEAAVAHVRSASGAAVIGALSASARSMRAAIASGARAFVLETAGAASGGVYTNRESLVPDELAAMCGLSQFDDGGMFS